MLSHVDLNADLQSSTDDFPLRAEHQFEACHGQWCFGHFLLEIASYYLFKIRIYVHNSFI